MEKMTVIAFLLVSVGGAVSAATLQERVDSLQSGATLVLEGGTYAVKDLPGRKWMIPDQVSGSPDAPTRIQVQPGATVLIDVSGASRSEEGVVEIGSGVEIHDVTIDGAGGTLIFDGGTTGGIAFTGTLTRVRFANFENRWMVNGFAGGTLIDCAFENLHIHHFGIMPDGSQSWNCWCGFADCSQWYEGKPPTGHCHGTYVGGTNIRFEGNYIHHGEGAAFHNYARDVTFTRNVIHDTSGGVATLGGGRQEMTNNVIFRNRGGGIYYGQGGQTIYHNTVMHNGVCGICPDGAADVRNNLVIGNEGDQISAGGTRSNNVTAGGSSTAAR